MSILSELAATPGVVAAGQYTWRGDRYTCEGQLDPEHARMASIMCRATTMATHMQARMLESLQPGCGLDPLRGWFVRGATHSVCVMANVFCFIDNARTTPAAVFAVMAERLGDAQPEAMI